MNSFTSQHSPTETGSSRPKISSSQWSWVICELSVRNFIPFIHLRGLSQPYCNLSPRVTWAMLAAFMIPETEVENLIIFLAEHFIQLPLLANKQKVHNEKRGRPSQILPQLRNGHFRLFPMRFSFESQTSVFMQFTVYKMWLVWWLARTAHSTKSFSVLFIFGSFLELNTCGSDFYRLIVFISARNTVPCLVWMTTRAGRAWGQIPAPHRSANPLWCRLSECVVS